MRAKSWLFAVSLLPAFLSVSVSAQTFEFLPEVDVWAKLNSTVRLRFQAKETRENGDPTQVELGPYINFYLKPLIQLRKISFADLDDSKSRALVLSMGYRHVVSADSPTVDRIIAEATSHLPLKASALMSDRNRAEFNFSNTPMTWRYRNRSTIQRTVVLHSYHPTPYASAEFYYDSKYQKWSSTALYVGCLLPMGRHTQIDPYCEHQNNTGKKPNQQGNSAGLILGCYI